MALPASGAISMSQVNTELGRGATTGISLGEAAVRTLAGKASGQISMSDLWGKSNAHVCTLTVGKNAAGNRFGYDSTVSYGGLTNRTLATPGHNTISALYQWGSSLYLEFSNWDPGTVELSFMNEFGVLYFTGWTQITDAPSEEYVSTNVSTSGNMSRYLGQTMNVTVRVL